MKKSINWPALLAGLLAAATAFFGAYLGAPPKIGGTPGGTPPPQVEPQKPEPQKPAADPRAAIGKLVMPGSYCSGTVVNERQTDGSYSIVSAAHCFKVSGEDVSFLLRDGRRVKATVTAIDRGADIALLRTEPVATPLPFVLVANETPAVGSKVLHAGFGQDVPGNTEYGRVIERDTPSGQVVYHLSVSPGDSGGGICLDAAGKLLSPVCCTTNLAAPGSVWGGKPERINDMLKNPTSYIGVPPALMPKPPGEK